MRAPLLGLRLALALASIAVALLAPSIARADATAHVRRIAVVVGANDPAPGRQPLRYAHVDAQRIADTLERVGRFAKPDVRVLIEPRPGDVLAALDKATQDLKSAGGDTLLVFYYSGHSDGQQLFPHGEALAVTDLRDRIARSTAKVRVAILDTCRGGSWTRAKGFTVGPPLDALDLANVGTEGTALLSSSSGLENAHEAAAMKGSFFTHHVVAGLLGAADKSGDGNVTLQEVFDYAKERTVRDSARMAVTPQHPSFDVQLRGRQDVVLAQVASAASALEVSQSNALEVIHLSSGVTVLETPPGKQRLRLALVPGRYVVRRVADGRVYSKEVEIRAGASVTLAEGQLEATGNERLATKDAVADDRPSEDARSTMAKGWWELRFALGASYRLRTFAGRGYPGDTSSASTDRSLAGILSLTYGITDRLSWSVPMPAFAYRIGSAGSFEVVPRVGLTSIGYSSAGGVIGTYDAAIATRAWLASGVSVMSNVGADSDFGRIRTDTVAARANVGTMFDVGDRLTFAFGAGWAGTRLLGETEPVRNPEIVSPPRTTGAIVVGSVQSLGYRQLPLLSVHLSRRFSVDAYASWALDLRGGPTRDRYLGGITWGF